MKSKSKAHEGLSLMFQCSSVLISINMDGAKEHIMGEFYKKCHAAGYCVNSIEPYSCWQNAAVGAIQEMKHKDAGKMVESKCLWHLWDHSIKLETRRSQTALDSYELQGQVPEMIVSGQTADILPFIEYGWYNWVKYYDQIVSFPNPKELLGHWLGPTIDLRSAMTAKILNANGNIEYNSTHHALTEAKLQNPDEIAAWNLFAAKWTRQDQPCTPAGLQPHVDNARWHDSCSLDSQATHLAIRAVVRGNWPNGVSINDGTFSPTYPMWCIKISVGDATEGLVGLIDQSMDIHGGPMIYWIQSNLWMKVDEEFCSQFLLMFDSYHLVSTCPEQKNGFFFYNFCLSEGTNFEQGMNFAGEDFNTMERKNENMAIETNVKKTMIKIKSDGG
jgi:hypothetical protein